MRSLEVVVEGEDGKPAFQPREGGHVSECEPPAKTESSGPDTDRDRETWKVRCRECSELVPVKPYCYECGAERPADGRNHAEEFED